MNSLSSLEPKPWRKVCILWYKISEMQSKSRKKRKTKVGCVFLSWHSLTKMYHLRFGHVGHSGSIHREGGDELTWRFPTYSLLLVKVYLQRRFLLEPLGRASRLPKVAGAEAGSPGLYVNPRSAREWQRLDLFSRLGMSSRQDDHAAAAPSQNPAGPQQLLTQLALSAEQAEWQWMSIKQEARGEQVELCKERVCNLASYAPRYHPCKEGKINSYFLLLYHF